MVPTVGLEPTCTKAANFKSAVTTNFTTRALLQDQLFAVTRLYHLPTPRQYFWSGRWDSNTTNTCFQCIADCLLK